jgi:hypothetical protein
MKHSAMMAALVLGFSAPLAAAAVMAVLAAMRHQLRAVLAAMV